MNAVDWRQRIPAPETGAFRAAMLVPNVGAEFYEPGDLTADDLRRIAEERAKGFRLVSGADRAWVRPIDPDVGASGFGLGIVLDFLSVGADTIAWTGAAIYLAKAFQAAKQKVEQEFPSQVDGRRITWSGEALQVIAVADLLGRQELTADLVRSVEHAQFSAPSPEPRLELDEIYSLHVIGIQIQQGGEDVVWTYMVYADGSVVSSIPTRLPGPSGPFWSEVTAGLSYLEPIRPTSTSGGPVG